MSNNDLKNIIKNSFYLYLVQGLNYLLPLITLPYLLIVLSSEDFGKYSFAFATSQFLILLVDFGFNLSATKKIAENSESEIIVKQIYWNITIIKIFLFFISIILILIGIFISDKIYFYREAIIMSMVMVLGTTLFPVWWFQGLNKMRQLSFINIISKLLTYPFLFVFVKKSTDSHIAIFIQSLAILFAGVISIIYIYRTHRFYFQNVRLKEMQVYIDEIKESWLIFLSNSSISLYTNSLTLLLGFFSSSYNVGLFGAMERIVRVLCFGVLGPMNQACFPVIAKLKIVDFEKAKRIFKIILISTFLIMLITFVFTKLFQNVIIDKFLKGYNSSGDLFSIFILMIFPIALGGILGQLGLLGLGHELQKKVFSKIYTTVGILSLPISIILIYYFNVEGAVYSMLIVEMIIFVSMLYFIKKYKYI
ncbi:polysaccharide transporter, PST family [Chryseobacterium carnipullorum]|uniref:oligosaccharide flippase family protein n=1 Tax=Chryseobacterium carnipullorum TaxID=1124835 RepID=UPI0009138C83|nr:oligosaccharide flippase family protein [Chryseobacterium carnipullorum]SHM64087.1 polysaccharide transporter, PST family [Chryseobacterium carnipullorum]